MNFFEHQAQARSQSRRLIVLFALAVTAIVVAISTVIAVVLDLNAEEEVRRGGASLFEREAAGIGLAAVATLAVIGLATLYKIAKLRSGGAAVARQLGGTAIPSDTADPAYRRLRNVVEEIAIASGVPVPEVYVLEEEAGINAFAAGYTPADAAVAVTRGALQQLNRDELQGVIAHEFSHVLNGDMRLNIRLMGVLFGILVLGIIGREFLLNTRGGRGKGSGGIVLVALAVMVIGYIGLFFGRLIKAGVSRQREFLADASAVQFTRQPGGIAGALKKIGALAEGSKLASSDAEEVSHMLFGDGVGYSALFATHPPLVERIRKLEPRFDPRELLEVARKLPLSATQAAAAVDAEAPVAGLAGAPSRREVAVHPDAVAAQVANPAADDYATAHRIAETIPERLRTLAHMQATAPGVVLALSLDADAAVRAVQLDAVAALDAETRAKIEEIAQALAGVQPIHRLPLAAMAFPTLRRRPRPWLERFVATLEAVIHADGRIQFSEYCLARLVTVQVMDALDPSRSRPIGRRKLVDCKADVAALFAVLARYGQPDAETAHRAYVAGVAGLGLAGVPAYAPAGDWGGVLDRALPSLDGLNPAGKELVIEGLVRTMSLDGRIAVVEAELLRTVCAALHCPLPPMLSS
jgi:Zn-dependent protease with chaperone function